MSKQSSRRSSLFLLELIAAIFFFSLASAVCVRFFVKSHTISQDTKNLDMAVNQASTFAELFRSGDDLFPLLEKEYSAGKLSPDKTTYTIYYDKNWVLCPEADAVFSLTIEQTADGHISSGSFVVEEIKGNKEIYNLEAQKYIQEEGWN